MKDKAVFTVLVADDEDELREAVCSLVPWEQIGFRLLGSAGNGLDALQLVEQLQPDLLLTDIRMPFITGTALARQVREVQPLIQVAFLSGFDDFEYAKLAIDSDVIAYLLKPISMEELTRSLREIHEKMADRLSALLPEGDAAGSLPLTVASLLLDETAAQSPEKQMQSLLSDYGMVFTPPYTLLVLSTRLGGELPRQSAALTVDQVLRKYYSVCSVVSGRRVLTLIVSEDGDARLSAALDELYQTARRVLRAECSIGVSRPFDSLRGCPAARREAEEAQRVPGEGIFRAGAEPRDAAEARRDGLSLLCEQALRMIEQRYMDEELSLGSVSETLHVSPNYLSANMKKYAGDTFINLLIKKRMETARAMLDEGALKIGQVAERCGYSDQHYFSFCFKKYYGVSPARLRRGEGAAP